MSKFDKRKIAATLAFASLFSGKSQAMGTKSLQTLGAVGGAAYNNDPRRIEEGASILGKVLTGLGITIVGVEAINEAVAGVMWAKDIESDTIFKAKYSLINFLRSKNKKNDGGEHSDKKKIQSVKENKRKNIKFKNRKGEYYETNIEMIKKGSKLSPENVNRLIDFINNSDNSFLDNMHSLHEADDMFKFNHYGEEYTYQLTEEVIKANGLSKGDSWVEKMFDGIRGKFKITRILDKGNVHEYVPGGKESNDKNTITFCTNENDGCYCINFFKDDKGNDLLRVNTDFKPYVIYLLNK